eukprot:TRINITY_DN9209_c0_g1_i1.p1 TRINITY_DN9209_c0_g1~~TRINITY_DN9209_c0_g1_i1.p1  ORF type:complete len:228 (+),score=40.06 TRINITY_DN9209_c0_g1_i1:43-726(+)
MASQLLWFVLFLGNNLMISGMNVDKSLEVSGRMLKEGYLTEIDTATSINYQCHCPCGPPHTGCSITISKSNSQLAQCCSCDCADEQRILCRIHALDDSTKSPMNTTTPSLTTTTTTKSTTEARIEKWYHTNTRALDRFRIKSAFRKGNLTWIDDHVSVSYQCHCPCGPPHAGCSMTLSKASSQLAQSCTCDCTNEKKILCRIQILDLEEESTTKSYVTTTEDYDDLY